MTASTWWNKREEHLEYEPGNDRTINIINHDIFHTNSNLLFFVASNKKDLEIKYAWHWFAYSLRNKKITNYLALTGNNELFLTITMMS